MPDLRPRLLLQLYADPGTYDMHIISPKFLAFRGPKCDDGLPRVPLCLVLLCLRPQSLILPSLARAPVCRSHVCCGACSGGLCVRARRMPCVQHLLLLTMGRHIHALTFILLWGNKTVKRRQPPRVRTYTNTHTHTHAQVCASPTCECAHVCRVANKCNSNCRRDKCGHFHSPTMLNLTAHLNI